MTTTFAVENPADESTVAEVAATPLAEVERADRRGPAHLRRRRLGRPRPSPSAPARSSALLDHIDGDAATTSSHTIVARGRPAARLRRRLPDRRWAWAWPARPIDLYLSMRHEEPNPVPIDELLQGRVALSLRRHEPVGVVTAITPYNGAIIMAFQKVVPP